METYFEDQVVLDVINIIKRKYNVVAISKKFRELQNDRDRASFAYLLMQEENIFSNFRFTENLKDVETSQKLRNEGNCAFRKRQNEKALELYNKSMCFAPVGSKEHALAVGNRSAVNFSLRCYNACLRDIQRALDNGYPSDLHFKLLLRKAKCLVGLRDCDATEKALKEAEKHLLSRCSKEQSQQKLQIQELEKDLQILRSDSNGTAINTFESPEDGVKYNRPVCDFGPNKEILSASSCLELKFDAEFGRHIVTTQDIYPGDILFVEEPFASVLLPDCYSTHCFYCLKRCFSSIPCLHCSTVIFCDESCRASSWDQNHRIDCPLLPTLVVSVGKLGLLALRVLIVAAQKEGGLWALCGKTKCYDNLDTGPRCHGFDSNNQYVSTNYRTIHSLSGNTKLRPNNDLFRRAIIANCLLYCLDTQTCFFQEIQVCPHCKQHFTLSDKHSDCLHALIREIYIGMKQLAGGLLLRYMQSIPCNAHNVGETVFRPCAQEGNPLLHADESGQVGAAFYAALSLLNHSCDPNVIRCSYGNWAVARAIRFIKCGDQVLDNYGYHCALHTLEERMQPLQQQYHFTCKCKACEEDWPLYKDLPNVLPETICQCGSSLSNLKAVNGVVQCKVCGTKTNQDDLLLKINKCVAEYSAVFSQCMSEPMRQRTSEEVNELLALFKPLQRVKRPWKHYSGAQELIKLFFLLQGSHCIFS